MLYLLRIKGTILISHKYHILLIVKKDILIECVYRKEALIYLCGTIDCRAQGAGRRALSYNIEFPK
jgi:hypothetical protein